MISAKPAKRAHSPRNSERIVTDHVQVNAARCGFVSLCGCGALNEIDEQLRLVGLVVFLVTERLELVDEDAEAFAFDALERGGDRGEASPSGR